WVLPAVAVAVGVAGFVAPSAASRSAVATGPAGEIQHRVGGFPEKPAFDEGLGAVFRGPANRRDGCGGPGALARGAHAPDIVSPDVITPDPPHNVATQNHVVNGGQMNGWNDLPLCMVSGVNQCISHYEQSQVPSLTAFADKYVVSDRTFSLENSPS